MGTGPRLLHNTSSFLAGIDKHHQLHNEAGVRSDLFYSCNLAAKLFREAIRAQSGREPHKGDPRTGDIVAHEAANKQVEMHRLTGSR